MKVFVKTKRVVCTFCRPTVTESHVVQADSRTRANHIYKFRPKTISSSYAAYKNSFFPRTIPQWNSLDKDTAEASLGADFSAMMRYINSRFTYLLTYVL